jgi:hypothetical protein
VVNRLGPFSPAELHASRLDDVLESWLDTLQQQQQDEAGEGPLQQWQLVGPGQRQAWPAVSVWYGLKVLLGLLEVRRGRVWGGSHV